MNIKYKITIVLVAFLAFAFSQERTKDTIDSQTVNVIKSYTPTISDAFKIKDIPSLNDANTQQKKEIKYNIFSIPVASTFTPAKGKAEGVDKAKPVKLYDNYASLGAGSFATILGEVYLNHELSNDETIGAYLNHHSSQGGIDGLLLDDNFLKTGLNLNYSKAERNFNWKADVGADIMTYNWYGLPQQFFDETDASDIESRLRYNSIYAEGKINFDNSAIVEDVSTGFRRFGDERNSGENRFRAKANFNVPILEETIKTEFRIDYLGGSFERNFLTNDAIDYGNFNLSLAPSYRLIQEDLTLDLGVRLVHFNDTELSKNKFFVYPNIEASYRLVNEILIGYAGITGDLQQNSFFDFATENPFVSPTLVIAPTDQQYNGFIGIKGKLSNTVSYNLKGNYGSAQNMALFKANAALTNATQDYQFGNSFNVVYDNINTLSFAGELNVDINRNFKLGIKGEYFNYSTDTEAEAWNLPDLTGSVFLDYQISEKWFMGSTLFFVGERSDQSIFIDGFSTTLQTVTLDSFFDANAHVGYKVTDYLSLFGKVNNIANQNYERWINFPVQGIQFLAGATYQFDF
jgi:hypothetical protein